MKDDNQIIGDILFKALEQAAKIGKVEEAFTGIRSKI
jgi:hypothetical protein